MDLFFYAMAGVMTMVVLVFVTFAFSEGVSAEEPKQRWGYKEVRSGVNLFWWLYETTHPDGFRNRPWIIWIQGGPGESGAGMGNFLEIGPLDDLLRNRSTTWVQEVSVLFVDSPVGSGYSYLSGNATYVTTTDQVVADLVTLLKDLLKSNMSEFETIPMIICGESYGGRVAVTLAKALHMAQQKKELGDLEIKSVLVGGPFISPIDTIDTLPEWMKAWSLVEGKGYINLKKDTDVIVKAIQDGEYKEAADMYLARVGRVMEESEIKNIYNVLSGVTLSGDDGVFKHLVKVMNGELKNKLGIPENVTWEGEPEEPFDALTPDVLVSSVDIVEYLLEKTPLSLTIYNGQMDLAVHVLGTERWVDRLQWTHASEYANADRVIHHKDGIPIFYKRHGGNLAFYWILKSGHAAPGDAGDACLVMLREVLAGKHLED